MAVPFVAVSGRQKYALLLPSKFVGSVIGARGANMKVRVLLLFRPPHFHRPMSQETEAATGCRIVVENEVDTQIPPPHRGVWRGVLTTGTDLECLAGLWHILRFRIRGGTPVALQVPLPTHELQEATRAAVGQIEHLTTCEVAVTSDSPGVHDDDSAVRGGWACVSAASDPWFADLDQVYSCVAIQGERTRVLTALKLVGHDRKQVSLLCARVSGAHLGWQCAAILIGLFRKQRCSGSTWDPWYGRLGCEVVSICRTCALQA